MHDHQPVHFMLLGSARTGSNLLLSLLSAHRSIKTYSELFNLNSLPPQALDQALADPLAYLRQRVRGAQPEHVRAVGFKMFYYHLTKDYFEKLIDPDDAADDLRDKFARLTRHIDEHYDWPELFRRFSEVWTALIADRELRVIHLKRRNILNTLISHKTAFKTNRWMQVRGRGPQQTTTLSLGANECRHYFERLEALATEADAAFADHEKIDVWYEDLAADRQAEMERVFAFLGVPAQPVSTMMAKQIVASPSEILANYRQLQESFRDTPWGRFFE